MSTLLSIQEVDDPLAERKKSLKRGEDILSELDGLRQGILAGAYSAEKLERLLSITKRQGEVISDPALREIIGEIELRAAVELAKLGKTH